MIVQWSGSPVEGIIYLLCVATSLLCAYLLLRAYFRSRTQAADLELDLLRDACAQQPGTCRRCSVATGE